MYNTEEKKKDLLIWLVKKLGECENSHAETTWNENAQEDYQFYAGHQDTPEVKAKLEMQNRPASVYNEVKPKIDMLVGMSAQMEGFVTLMPRNMEDAPLTELMTGTMDFFSEKMRLSSKQTKCFDHCVKSGLSWLHFYVDQDDVESPLKCARIPGRDMHKDPDCIEVDLSDCRFLFRDKWLEGDDIEAAWPQFKFPKDSAGNIIITVVTGVHKTAAYTPTFFNEANNKHRLVEGWWRKYEYKYTFVNPLTQQQEELFETEFKAFAKELKDGFTLPNEQVIQQDELPSSKKLVQTLWYAIFLGDKILEVERSIYQHKTYPYAYVEAYHDEENNTALSVVDAMKDPQRGLNTTRRQLIHLLQTAPKGILIHEVGTVLNIEDYEDNSSKPGFHLEVAKGGIDKLKFTAQPNISPIYAQLDGLFQQSMKDSSGIQDALLGIQTSTREPGVTARMRQDASVAVLHILFDNLKEFKYNCSKILLANIQQFISDEQLIRIRGEEGYQLMQINSQMNPQSEGWNDISGAKFDLIIDEDIVTKSTKLAVAQLLTEFNQNNPGSIPPDIMLEYANIPFTTLTKVRQHHAEQQEMAMIEMKAEQDKVGKELSLEEREVVVKEKELQHKIKIESQGGSDPKPKPETGE